MTNPNEATTSIILGIRNRHKDLETEELELKTKAINNYSEDVSVPTESDIQPLLTRIKATLRQHSDIDVNLIF
jgi:hypothetical protein